MKQLSARYLLGYTTSQLHDLLTGPFLLKFDDGEVIQTNARATIYSSYFWEFHRKHQNTPILKKHHVSFVLKDKALTSKTHIELLGSIYWDVADTYHLKTPIERDHLTKMVYEITNTLYVDLSYRTPEAVVSIDILDFIAINRHRDVIDVLKEVNCGTNDPNTDYGRKTIDAAYKKLLEVLEKGEGLDQNALARAVRAKMVNPHQVLQCVGPQGFKTEVDGAMINVPVTKSYVEGMGTLYNMMAESRSAAKALYFSESPLQDSEYFARRLQLQCMVVEKLHHQDCGSTNYVHWRIKPPREIGGRVTYPGDLKFMVGKYYLDEDTNTLKMLKASDTHLFNKSVKLRSVMTCKHPDPHGVCSVCFGGMSDNVTPESNLGHVCAATMTQQTSQSVLSTKHLDASSSSEPIALSELGHRFFTVGKNGKTYLLKRELKNLKVRVIITQEEARGLTDILRVENVEDINPSRVSEIDSVTFEITEGDLVTFLPVTVSQNGRFALFTSEFLEYVKLARWEFDTRSNFIFNISGWDFDKPMLTLPEMEYSFSFHSRQVAEIIESRMKEIESRTKPESPVSTLIELFDLVNAKLNVNLALLEVILYANMVAFSEMDDFGLARNSENASLGVSDMTLKNRSLSAAYSYEKQLTYITDPRSFYKMNRPDSVFDAFVCPKEVVDHYKAR